MDAVSTEKSITITEAELDKLLGHGDGNAALLYLHVLRRGGFSIARAARELKCTEAELTAAAGTLRALGVLDPPERAPERRESPEYTARDLSAAADNDPAFEAVVAEAEGALGHVMSSNDLRLLFGIYDYWGLPADVMMLLLHHCVEKYQLRYGAGRIPTMRYVEKEAQSWARAEANSLDAAEELLRRERERQGAAASVAEALQIRGRAPSAGEAKYIDAWLDMGFGSEAVAEAYDRTVLNTGKLSWNYLDRILRSWDEKGLYTPEAIEAGDPRRANAARRAAAQPPSAEKSDDERLDAMRRMYEHMKKENSALSPAEGTGRR